jgi:cell division protease FtsH
MFSEKAVNIINDEVNKVVKKAYDRATQLLKENSDILEAIVEALVERKIMSESELDEIWKKVVASRTTN